MLWQCPSSLGMSCTILPHQMFAVPSPGVSSVPSPLVKHPGLMWLLALWQGVWNLSGDGHPFLRPAPDGKCSYSLKGKGCPTGILRGFGSLPFAVLFPPSLYQMICWGIDTLRSTELALGKVGERKKSANVNTGGSGENVLFWPARAQVLSQVQLRWAACSSESSSYW